MPNHIDVIFLKITTRCADDARVLSPFGTIQRTGKVWPYIMKVSCLTFHDSLNYGSVLQTYALQTVLTAMGHDYEVINYANEEKHRYDSIFRSPRGTPYKYRFLKLSDFPYYAYKKWLFTRFSNRYLNKTSRFYTMEQLRAYAADRDAILVGSDQVWNPAMIRHDPAYFLKFAEPSKKIAYAASLGLSSVTEADQGFFQDMLSDFHRIAVRESTGAHLVKEMTGKSVKVVLDPTLLLTREDWETICPPPPQKPYIFAYILGYNPDAIQFLKRLQVQTGLEVRFVSQGWLTALQDGATRVPSPAEWVTQIMHAEYVVTTSFHGTAFSTNFRRNFYSFAKGGAGNGQNSRLADFLRWMGLESRLNLSLEGDISTAPPDYAKAELVLAEKRAEARAYLEQALAAV